MRFRRGKTKEAGSWKSETVPVKYKHVGSLCIKALRWSMDEWIELVGGLYALRKLYFPVCLLLLFFFWSLRVKIALEIKARMEANQTNGSTIFWLLLCIIIVWTNKQPSQPSA